MIKDILNSIRAIIAGYIFDVVGILVVTALVSITPLKGAYWVYLIVSYIFVAFGGYVAASVSKRFRLINSTLVGTIHIFWALFMGGYKETTHILIIQLLAIPLAILGGIISRKTKPQIRETEQI